MSRSSGNSVSSTGANLMDVLTWEVCSPFFWSSPGSRRDRISTELASSHSPLLSGCCNFSSLLGRPRVRSSLWCTRVTPFCMFQVFRISALFIRGVADVIPPSSVDLQGVSIPRRDVGACISCVQHFVRSPCSRSGVFLPTPAWICCKLPLTQQKVSVPALLLTRGDLSC